MRASVIDRFGRPDTALWRAWESVSPDEFVPHLHDPTTAQCTARIRGCRRGCFQGALSPLTATEMVHSRSPE